MNHDLDAAIGIFVTGPILGALFWLGVYFLVWG